MNTVVNFNQKVDFAELMAKAEAYLAKSIEQPVEWVRKEIEDTIQESDKVLPLLQEKGIDLSWMVRASEFTLETYDESKDEGFLRRMFGEIMLGGTQLLAKQLNEKGLLVM